jgi:MFS family permease
VDTQVQTSSRRNSSEITVAPPDVHDTTDFSKLPGRLVRSLVSVVMGTLVLRLSSHVMGLMLGFYLAEIDRNYYPISYTERGFIIAAFFIPELLGSPILGAMSDRYGRKLFILLGPILGALAVQITSLTTAIWLLVFTRLLEGLSTASSVPSTLGYITEATVGRPKLRARVMGLFEITFVGGIAVGSSVAGYLWSFSGQPKTVFGFDFISPAFALNAVLYLISLGIFWAGMSEVQSRAPQHAVTAESWKRFITVLRAPQVWKFVPAWLGINSIIGAWLNTANGLMIGKDHFVGQLLPGNISEKEFGNGFAVLGIVFAAGVLAWSFYIRSYRRTNIMLLATAGLFATLATVYSLNHMGSFDSSLHYPLLGILFLSVLALSAFMPAALIYLADVTESKTEDRGSIMGLYSVFLGVGQLIGTTSGGKFATWAGIDGLLLLSTILGVITACTLFALRQQEPQFTKA